MCGIAGSIGNITPLLIKSVANMNSQQIHRGPDYDGIWQSDAVGKRGAIFAHRRLSIIDLSANAAQPMIDKESGNAIVFNGEIYNYKILKQELINEGARFDSLSDTEVILVAYKLWGKVCVKRLRGIFAFAIWDNSRRTTFLARDHLGVKPLYYSCSETNDNNTFLFASELRTILNSGLVSRKLSEQAISSFIWNGFVPEPTTIVKGIELVSPGTTITVDNDGKVLQRESFWSINANSNHNKNVEPLKTALIDSVKLQQISDVPIGVFLSGGIDSSAIATLAATVSGQPIHTFNISFAESDYDESKYARKIASELGARHTEIRLTENDFFLNLDNALNSLDQPTFDGINTYFLSKSVREMGFSVALAGTGGDELFGGYTSFKDIPKATAWSRRLGVFPDSVLKLIGKLASRIKYRKHGDIPSQVRWGKMVDVLLTRGDLLGVYQTAYSLFTSDYRKLLLKTSTNEIEYGIDRNLADKVRSSISGVNQLEAISILEMMFFLGQRLLRDIDSASMSVSLEVRVPLLDHIVVEEIFKITPELRFSPIGNKHLLKNLAMPNFDTNYFNRQKSGFVLPIEKWLTASMKATVEETFRDKNLICSIGLEQDAILKLFHAYLSGAPGIYWTRIWAIFTLLRWCKRNCVYL